MKHSFLLLLATLFALAAPMAPAQTDDSVSIDFFYDALSPYGDWIYTPNYGYVWQPLVAQQSGWAPYSDGSWAYTDAGWTWISNEDFGWATYHYGRWILLQQNWVWVPGYEWAPAWVSWRQTQGQIGWAPLPPEAAWTPNIGFGGWTDSYYDVGPAYYNFVPVASFASTASLLPYILNRSRNYSFYDQSVNITNIAYRQNVLNHIFVGGPDPARVDRFGGNPVRRLTLHRDDDRFRQNWNGKPGDRPRGAGGPAHIERDQLFIASPSIRRDASHALPPRVREHMNQPQIDRGWQGAGDPQNAERIRQFQREELAKNRPQNLPEKNQPPVTSVAPPPAVGRALRPEERNGGGGIVQRPDPRQREEEIRRGIPGVSNEPPPGIPNRRMPDPSNPPDSAQNERPQRENRSIPQPGNIPGGTPAQRSGGFPPNQQGNPPAPQTRVEPPRPTAPQVAPQLPNQGREFPGNRGRQPQGRIPPEQHQPTQPNAPQFPQQPRVNPAPMPQPHVQPQRPAQPHVQPQRPAQPMPQPQQPTRPMPQPGGQAPHMPQQPHIAPPSPGAGPQGSPGHRR